MGRPAGCHPDRLLVAKGLCRTCYTKAWRLRHPDWKQLRSPEAKARRAARASARGKAGKSRWRVLQSHGLEPEEFDTMLASQGGVCAICGGPPTRPSFAIDHAHETGAVRGLLCDRCNVMLGMARDSVNVLAAGIAYLEAARG